MSISGSLLFGLSSNTSATPSSNWSFHCLIWFGCRSNWVASSLVFGESRPLDVFLTPQTLIALQRRQCDLRFERGAVVSSRTSCHLSLLLPGIAAGSGADNPPNSPVQISRATSDHASRQRSNAEIAGLRRGVESGVRYQSQNGSKVAETAGNCNMKTLRTY